MRTKNSIINIVTSILSYIFLFLLNLIVRKILISTLGSEYLGINGLFNNILNMLSIAELGIGSSIIYHLYKPIAEKNHKKVTQLMSFYKRCYIYIALFILFAGIIISIFIPDIVGKVNIEYSVRFLFYLSLIDIVSTYLLSYKRSIFIAYQKYYVISMVHIVQVIFIGIVKIYFLYRTKSYVIFILISIIGNILENVLINHYANKKYSFINNYSGDIGAGLKKDIFIKVKGLMIHRISGVLIQSTDNIIISKFIGISMVGLYSNYSTIIVSLQSMITSIFNSISSSVGNLIATENNKKINETFDNIFFINGLLYIFSSSILLVSLQPFISIWVGNNYLISYTTVLLIVLSFFLQGNRKALDMFTSASGIFYENRLIPLIECFTNLSISVILVNFIGINGVFIGTIFSTIVSYIFGYQKYLNRKVLKRKKSTFYKLLFGHTLIQVIIIAICTFIVNIIFPCKGNLFLLIVIRGLMIFIFEFISIWIIYGKKKEFEYTICLMKNEKLKRLIRRR